MFRIAYETETIQRRRVLVEAGSQVQPEYQSIIQPHAPLLMRPRINADTRPAVSHRTMWGVLDAGGLVQDSNGRYMLYGRKKDAPPGLPLIPILIQWEKKYDVPELRILKGEGE
jgi:hypothetical protein